MSRFEHLCFENEWAISYDTITKLYEDPEALEELVPDDHLRMKARACIQEAVHQEYIIVYDACTAEGQKLASKFAESDFVSKLIPEDGILKALKAVIVPAVKMIAL